jgi:hypothetical protein
LFTTPSPLVSVHRLESSVTVSSAAPTFSDVANDASVIAANVSANTERSWPDVRLAIWVRSVPYCEKRTAPLRSRTRGGLEPSSIFWMPASE